MSSAKGLAGDPGNTPLTSRKLFDRVFEDVRRQGDLYIGFKKVHYWREVQSCIISKAYVQNHIRLTIT